MVEELVVQPSVDLQINVAVVGSELSTTPDKAMANSATMDSPSNPKITVVSFILDGKV